MVLKVVQQAKLMVNEIVVDDALLHRCFIHGNFFTLVAAASQEGEDAKERETSDDQERDVDKIDN